MAISTKKAHIYAAKSMQEHKDSTYIALGKPDSWEDDDNPPAEEYETSELDNIIGYKKVKQFSLARPLNSGESVEDIDFPTVSYKDTDWVLIPSDKAFEENANFLYIEAEILADDFDSGEYRQVGVYMDVRPNTGITRHNLLPEDVDEKGILQFYENRQPQTRTSSVHVTEQFMVEM